MRFAGVLILFLLAPPAAEIRYFQYDRPIEMTTRSSGQTCAVVEPDIFAHASAGLADLRIYQGSTETPYVVQSDVPALPADQIISPLNLGRSGGQTVFDAEMPQDTYSDVQLGIEGHDFLATVTVSGSQSQTASGRTKLGSFTIFDLTRQRLGRSTVLHLPDSDFRYLHFQIEGGIAPGSVTGLSVTRPPKSQPKYRAAAETAKSTLQGRDSVFEFSVPAHTPIDRIVFTPEQSQANFSRDVLISVAPVPRKPADDTAEPPTPVSGSGTILRVHSAQNGRRIDEEDLTVDAPRVNFDVPAKWTVTIENHDDAPIQLSVVQLEMLERKLCFDAVAGNVYTLYYGDAALALPVYDYATLFAPQQNPVAAKLGAESANSAYQPRPDERPFTERHPALLWIALVLAIALLGLVAFRSFKQTPANPG